MIDMVGTVLCNAHARERPALACAAGESTAAGRDRLRPVAAEFRCAASSDADGHVDPASRLRGSRSNRGKR
jgi:hypothetical protein